MALQPLQLGTDADERRKLWHFLMNGPSVEKIRRQPRAELPAMGLPMIVNAIAGLEEGRHLVIPYEQQIFPLQTDRGIPFRPSESWIRKVGKEWIYVPTKATYDGVSNKAFKKRGYQFRLKTGTVRDRQENCWTPQERMISSIERVYDEIDSHFYADLDFVARRGWSWDSTIHNHILLTQRNLMRGWRLASLIMHFDSELGLSYSNPGSTFYLGLPSSTRDPQTNRYDVKIFGVEFDSIEEALGKWCNIQGDVTISEDDDKNGWGEDKENNRGGKSTAISGVDIYSDTSQRYAQHELNFNFQCVAAAVLRQHYNDTRVKDGRAKTLKRCAEQPMPPVTLNIPLVPAKEMVEFDVNLDWVMIEYVNERGQVGLKKLNSGEREVLLCHYLYQQRKTGNMSSCYVRDDSLKSIDETVQNYVRALEIEMP